MKKIGILLMAIFATFTTTTVKAQENKFYTNNNNVSMTKEEYNYLSNFFSDSYISNMSNSQFRKEIDNKLILKEVNNKYIKTMTYYDSTGNATSTDYEISKEDYDNANTNPQTRSACVDSTSVDCWETSYKKLALFIWGEASSTSTWLRAVLVNTWKSMPTKRSYDVIGYRFSNYTLTTAWGDQYTSSGTINYSYGGNNMKIASNGVGISQNLVDGNITLLHNRIVMEGNTTSSSLSIYGSYQHATNDVTLAQSKNYNFANGLGGVFSFNSGIGSNYDAMQGVSYVY